MKGIIKARYMIAFSIALVLAGPATGAALPENGSGAQDSTYLRQQLFNGRIWISRYENISGHEFFLTEALSSGSVTVNGRTFNDQLLRYDICTDRVILMVSPGFFVELNRECAGEFTLTYSGQNYRFENIADKGYFQVLSEGKTLLVRKYEKTIWTQTLDGSEGRFEEIQSDYIVKNGMFFRLRRKRDLLTALADREEEIRQFMRRNGIGPDIRNTGAIASILRFYDSL